MQNLITAVTILVVLCLPVTALAHGSLDLYAYQENSWFVKAPARAGGALFGVSGAVLGSVLGILSEPVALVKGERAGKTTVNVAATGALTGWLSGQWVIGAPFYFVESLVVSDSEP